MPEFTPRWKLVIFDCDGVLVDSEPIGARVFAGMLWELGIVMSPEECCQRFRGSHMADCLGFIGERLGRPAPDDFAARFRDRCVAAYHTELEPIPGIHVALERIALPRCVASNGPAEKMQTTLGLTGLLEFFEDRIFSAYDIQRWKPEPDLYLHAAEQCGVAARDCVVVEDSAFGVQAAVTAGMHVLGFAPNGEAEDLEQLGARTFRSMTELPDLLIGREAGPSFPGR